MLLLTTSTDKIQIVADAVTPLDVHASWMDYSNGVVTPGCTNTAKTSTGATDIVAGPSDGNRSVRKINVKNTHSTQGVGIIIQHIAAAGTALTIFRCRLEALEELDFSDYGWYKYDVNGTICQISGAKLDLEMRVDIDQTFTSSLDFNDIGEFSAQVITGKKYAFIANIFHTNNASTTGNRFALQGPTMTDVIVGNIQVVTNSVTAAALSAGVTASLNTAATADTTGSVSTSMTILSGSFKPSANGRVSIRAQSEVAVAAGLTVKVGSWFRIWEVDN